MLEQLEPRMLLAGGWDAVLVDSTLLTQDVLAHPAVDGAEIIQYDGARESASDVLSRVTSLSQAKDSPLHFLSILSQGAPGAFKLGNEWITKDNVHTTAEAWAQLREVMADGAILYIFGNDTAEGPGGRALLDRLAELSGVDVFASDNPTGGVASASSDTGPAELSQRRELVFVDSGVEDYQLLIDDIRSQSSRDPASGRGSAQRGSRRH